MQTPSGTQHGVHFEDGELRIDGVPAEELARAAGTPLYVYSASLIRERFARLVRAFDGLAPRVRYAVKANGNSALLRLLLEQGAGFDLVSGGELQRALHVGARPEDLVYAGVGKQDWEIQLALRAGVGLLAVESESELERIAWLAQQEGAAARLALRVNPDVDVDTHAYIRTGAEENKFGVDLDAAARLLGKLHDDPRLSLVAYHVHLGSLLLEAEPYLEACRRVMDFYDADETHRRGVTSYDIGGGFGSRGPFDGEVIDLETLAGGLRELLVPRGLSLLLEPGRFLVGDAGVLLTRIVHVKEGRLKDYYIVDAAMNDLLRPALYQAEHDIRPVAAGGAARARPVDVVGPVCESADWLGLARELPVRESGDLLAVFSAGAYGFSMASNYNARPLPAEVLCEEGAPRLIRRRQRLEDLSRDEVDAELEL